tara:strand:- start:3710 stop:4417 length:708 start_codon:yes stop_codon:yes gene_type:complete
MDRQSTRRTRPRERQQPANNYSASNFLSSLYSGIGNTYSNTVDAFNHAYAQHQAGVPQEEWTLLQDLFAQRGNRATSNETRGDAELQFSDEVPLANRVGFADEVPFAREVLDESKDGDEGDLNVARVTRRDDNVFDYDDGDDEVPGHRRTRREEYRRREQEDLRNRQRIAREREERAMDNYREDPLIQRSRQMAEIGRNSRLEHRHRRERYRHHGHHHDHHHHLTAEERAAVERG